MPWLVAGSRGSIATVGASLLTTVGFGPLAAEGPFAQEWITLTLSIRKGSVSTVILPQIFFFLYFFRKSAKMVGSEFETRKTNAILIRKKNQVR